MQHGPASLSSSPDVEEFASVYAAFAASLRVSDLPAHVIDAARANLLDTLACAFAGSNAPGVA